MKAKAKKAPEVAKLRCGLVMPISACDGCTSDHWEDVREILIDAISAIPSPVFEVALVSDAEDSGLIHARIVRNLHDCEIVVCDVSGKNPNVMFELGLRLAFDKPTVIVKDEKTSYTFDTSGIEHLEYPRDLRFATIMEFKRVLGAKVAATVEAAKRDPKHSPFLGHFGRFDVKGLDVKQVDAGALLQMMSEMRADFALLRSQVSDSRIAKPSLTRSEVSDLSILPDVLGAAELVARDYLMRRPNLFPESKAGRNLIAARLVARGIQPATALGRAVTEKVLNILRICQQSQDKPGK